MHHFQNSDSGVQVTLLWFFKRISAPINHRIPTTSDAANLSEITLMFHSSLQCKKKNKKKHFSCSFALYAPTLWNDLPDDI